MSRVLYLSYDGLTDPLGRSQVIPYLAGLAGGHAITIISFEKEQRYRAQGERVRALLEDMGMEWRPLPYTKQPPVLSTVRDVRRMRRLALRLHRQQPFALVHCRSYIASLVGLELKRRHGIPFLFDMRGFWADERVDGGLWNLGNPLYRLIYGYFKRKEAEFLGTADGIVSLTEAGKAVIQGWQVGEGGKAPIAVIPCSVDFEKFTPATHAERLSGRAALGIPADALVVLYLGSIGTWYLLREMLDFFAALKGSHPEARLVFITHDDPAPILAGARERMIREEDLVVRAAEREEVPGFIAAADLGLFFIKQSFSKTASSPTKLGEYFAAGIPVVTNSGVGDVAEIVARVGGGAIVDEFTDAEYAHAIAQIPRLLAIDGAELRDRSAGIFDLDRAVATYAELYRTTLGVTPR